MVGALARRSSIALAAALAVPWALPAPAVHAATSSPPCQTATGSANADSVDGNGHYTCFDDSAPRVPESASTTNSSSSTCSSVGNGILAPHWTYVPGSSDPTTIEGQVTYSKYATDDTFWDHHTSDSNFFVYPDAQYQGMLAAPGNFHTGEPNELGRIEVEWEFGSFPSWALPRQGDRVHVEGAYIFDCGHSPGYRSEIHPPRLVMALRNQAQDSYGGQSTPRPGWPGTLPGLGSLPIATSRADIYASSDGGEAREQENCFGLLSGCPFGLDWYQPLADHNYHLFVPAPVKPAGNYSMLWQATDRPIPGGMTRFTPTITPSTDPSNPGVNVDYDFSSFTEPSNHLYGAGTSVVVGWNKPAVTAPRRVKVVIDSYHVDDPMDGSYTLCLPTCTKYFFDGKWSLSTIVGDRFSYLLSPDKNVDLSVVCTPFNTDIQPGDYSIRPFSIVVGGGCPGVDVSNSFEVTLLPGQPLRVFVRGVEHESFTPNQEIGLAEHIFTEAQNYGVGASYTEKLQPLMSAGDDAMESFCPCGSVTYHIDDDPLPQPPSTALVVGSPSVVAGSTTFVTSATSITLTGSPPAGHASDAVEVHERYWRAGTSAPAETLCSANPCVIHLNANDGLDGAYTIEYWTVDTTTGVIETVNSASLTLDKTAPSIVITQPAATQYAHSATLTLDYSVSDGSGSGVATFVPTLDGATTVGGHGLQPGQAINLLTEVSLGTHTFTVVATDRLGNNRSISVTFTVVVTPTSIEDDVNGFVASGDITKAGIAESLLAKLNAAAAAQASGNCPAAINIWNAFINEIQAQVGKSITQSAANIMIADAQYVIAHCT
jgi:hypothetical protein